MGNAGQKESTREHQGEEGVAPIAGQGSPYAKRMEEPAKEKAMHGEEAQSQITSASLKPGVSRDGNRPRIPAPLLLLGLFLLLVCLLFAKYLADTAKPLDSPLPPVESPSIQTNEPAPATEPPRVQETPPNTPAEPVTSLESQLPVNQEDTSTPDTAMNHGTRTFSGITMVWIPPGSFTMGSPTGEMYRNGNETQHHVMLTKGFWLGQYEVTQAQWEAVMGYNPAFFQGDPRLPEEQVSWSEIQEFIQRLNAEGGGGFRLPTEAEWEYACRAGSAAAYSFAGDDSRLPDYAWYGFNSFDQTHPVGQKRPNAWGAYDMHGNVYEWCQDWFGDYPTGDVTDPTGAGSGVARVYRGGSWASYPGNVRSADRAGGTTGILLRNVGFRLAR